MDYRRFLDKTEETVAPVVEHEVWLRDRRLKVEDATSGWWRVRVRGRSAELLRAATDEEVGAVLALLPAVRGPLLRVGDEWALVVGGSGGQLIDLARSDEEPPLFSPLKARHWPAGELLLWDEVEWESEAEEAARRALDERRGLGDVKGVSAALRAAFAFATVQAASRTLGIPAAPAELVRWVRDIAEQGPPAAETALRALAAERATWAARGARPQPHRPATSSARRENELEARVEESLRGAGARLLGVRRATSGLVEVRWQFSGTRFISVVHESGLRVVDAGVCLAGSDDLVTLDSLPGVIREAMDEGALVITRHGGD